MKRKLLYACIVTLIASGTLFTGCGDSSSDDAPGGQPKTVVNEITEIPKGIAE